MAGDPAIIELTVNGELRSLRVDPSRTLLRVLREDLDLTGAKEGCGGGHCGTCAVILDGKVVLSCEIPIADAAGKQVTTIEALGADGCLDPIQEAFLDTGAVQCGYCSPGMVIAAKALLDQNTEPSEKQIRDALSRHLCRCTGYVKIIDAVKLAAAYRSGKAVPGSPVLDSRSLSPNPGRFIGKAMRSKDAVEKITGRTKYAADLAVEGMLHAVHVRSPHAFARILSIDLSSALALPGVVDAFTASDIPGANRLGFLPDQPVLCKDLVRCVGDPVAVVTAVTEDLARRAAELIRVEYEVLPAVFDPESALQEGAPRLYENGNVCCRQQVKKGNIEEGFRQADIIIEHRYTTPFNEHGYLETDSGLAWIDSEGHLEMHTGCQSVHFFRSQVAVILGVPEEQVRVYATQNGGTFGSKAFLSLQGALAVACWRLRRPVKMVYSREEVMQTTAKRHAFRMVFKSGVTRDGRVTALKTVVLADTGAYAGSAKGIITKGALHTNGPYNIPNLDVDITAVYTNNPLGSAMRGYGVPQVSFAMESQMDEMARAVGMDPIAFRRRNAIRSGDTTSSSQPVQWEPGFVECLDAIEAQLEEEKAGPAAAVADAGTTGTAAAEVAAVGVTAADEAVRTGAGGGSDGDGAGPWRKGVGYGGVWVGIGTIGRPSYAEAYVDLLEDGRIKVVTGGMELGQGFSTTMLQIAAEALGQPPESLELVCGVHPDTPDAGFTSASRQTYVSGNAVLSGAALFKKEAFRRAVPILGVAEEDLELVPEVIAVHDRPDLNLPLWRLAEAGGPFRVTGSYGMVYTPVEADGKGAPCEIYAVGAARLEISVNVATGQIRVDRVLAAHNVGRLINPVGAAGQLDGCAVMGLGFALKEEFIPGRTLNFARYRMLRANDVPGAIVPILLEIPSPKGPFGVHGLAEHALVPMAGAVANAVYDACGVHIRDLPITPTRVLHALEAAGAGSGKGPI
ncbi:MAG: molybdopterin-dependent oxidoreductase [Firmicutes bacterium]|nr:molybdopterin-dependent oxidoreductase [Bacillota bacterium]